MPKLVVWVLQGKVFFWSSIGKERVCGAYKYSVALPAVMLGLYPGPDETCANNKRRGICRGVPILPGPATLDMTALERVIMDAVYDMDVVIEETVYTVILPDSVEEDYRDSVTGFMEQTLGFPSGRIGKFSDLILWATDVGNTFTILYVGDRWNETYEVESGKSVQGRIRTDTLNTLRSFRRQVKYILWVFSEVDFNLNSHSQAEIIDEIVSIINDASLEMSAKVGRVNERKALVGGRREFEYPIEINEIETKRKEFENLIMSFALGDEQGEKKVVVVLEDDLLDFGCAAAKMGVAKVWGLIKNEVRT